MSHIASPDFYTDVRNNIYRSKKWWYTLFYEGVRPWTEESSKKFKTALWLDITPELYDSLSTLYGIKSQDNSLFLWVVNNKDINIDLDLDTIMEIYESKTSLKNNNAKDSYFTIDSEITNAEEIIQQSIDSLSERELDVLRYLNQSLMNMIIKNAFIRDFMLQAMWKEDIFSVILDDRNEHLVTNILERDEKKIFIIYGLMHFEGVFELLQNHDSKWEIISEKSYRVIR